MRLGAMLVVSIVLVTGGLWWSRNTAPRPALAQAPGQSPRLGQSGKVVGAGSCSVLGVCHGSASPRTQYNVNQNEHAIWLKKDKHARAYDVLLKNRSSTIAKNLALPVPAAQSPRCLHCHALNVPVSQRTEKFQLEDGVSCEACHGPAENWLIEHARTGPEGYQQSVQLGMYDIRDLRKRAEKCLSCHLGDAEKNVDHELLAAGHPLLTFELDTFSARMPPHWKAPKGEWVGAHTLVIGQAVALREALHQLARRIQPSNTPGWPEFAEFDCFACHHTIQNVDSTYYTRAKDTFLTPGTEWSPSRRQARGFPGVAGIPPWEASQYLVFRQFVAVMAPEARPTLDQELAALATHMGKMSTAAPEKILSFRPARLTSFVESVTPDPHVTFACFTRDASRVCRAFTPEAAQTPSRSRPRP